MTPTLLASIDGCEVWLGNCLEPETAEIVMQGRSADLLVVDAPYSERTHEGHRAGKVTADRAAGFGDHDTPATSRTKRAELRYAARRPERADIEYDSWSTERPYDFCSIWMPHVTGWAATITDHVLASPWDTAFALSGRYVFQPLPWVETGSRVRMLGDGPSNWTCWLVVARPRSEPWSTWGTTRGAYVGPGENHQNRPDRITGAKSLALTGQLIRDYSRRGDLVLDPCLGGGTTLIAALRSGRRCIGIEKDKERAELCAKLLRESSRQPALPFAEVS